MPILEIHEKKYKVDDEGYLEDWSIWTKGIAEAIAKIDNFTLEFFHWEYIEYARIYYDKYQVSPTIEKFVDFLEKILGKNNFSYRFHLYKLFPKGPMSIVCKYAGLPKPTG